ncbi:OB-fold protein [Croceimicrobium sp.]|uniref:OB-fold protein n=1 Tax=Croceimicrobium sp. TaxID=2828340 RepID=UPI003BA89342
MKKLLLPLLIVAALAIAAYWYVFHKPHRDLIHENAAFSLSATHLMNDFQKDRSLADSLYIDQIISLKGVVKELQEAALILEPGIYGSLDSTASMPALKVGDSVQIRGRVLSYDELFEEVKLDFVQFENQ